MIVAAVTVATAVAATDLLDLALLGAKGLQRVERAAGARRSLSRAADHESSRSRARQRQQQFAIHY